MLQHRQCTRYEHATYKQSFLPGKGGSSCLCFNNGYHLRQGDCYWVDNTQYRSVNSSHGSVTLSNILLLFIYSRSSNMSSFLAVRQKKTIPKTIDNMGPFYHMLGTLSSP